MRQAKRKSSSSKLWWVLLPIAILLVIALSVGPGSASTNDDPARIAKPILRDLGSTAGADMTLAGRQVTVEELREKSLHTQYGTQDIGAALQLVQFSGPIKDEWLGAIQAAGATPIQYIATNGYLLWADADSRAELDKMVTDGEFLVFSALYPVDLKIGPMLEKLEDPDEMVRVVIQMYRHVGRISSEAAIRNLSVAQSTEWTPILAYQNTDAAIRVGDVDDIIRLPDVFWVELRMERQRMDEVQGQILAGNLNGDQSGPSGTGYLAWLNSYGFSTDPSDYPIVDVTDDGIGNGTVNSGDPTLHEFGLSPTPPAWPTWTTAQLAANGGGPDGHGHINISIAGGYDTRGGFPFQDPNGLPARPGDQPLRPLWPERASSIPGFDLSACGGTDTGLIESIQDNGAQISSNSWGCAGCAGTYDDSSQAFDVGVRDADLTESGNQELIFVFSAGNDGPGSGTVGTPGNGKNMITVGASENQRPSDEDGSWTDGCGVGPTGADDAMDVISFSSRGPSPGSRVKPEVIAPGTHIQGTASTNASYNGSGVCDQYRPSGQTTFAASSGTSHSTPAVAGVASLAYYWMENTYSGHAQPGADEGLPDRPSDLPDRRERQRHAAQQQPGLRHAEYVGHVRRHRQVLAQSVGVLRQLRRDLDLVRLRSPIPPSQCASCWLTPTRPAPSAPARRSTT